MKTNNPKDWTRREFTVQSALAMLSGVAITLSACGDSGSPSSPSTPPPTTTTPPASGNVTGVVGTNHGHTAVIASAQLTAGNAIALDITGNANHPHTVNVTAAELGQIAAGTRVQTTSTNNTGHAHTVTFN